MNDVAGLLDEVVERITKEVNPLRIIVFGSALSGKMEANSDLDLLVEMPDSAARLDTAYRIHHCLRGLGCARDIVVVLESEVKELGDNPYLVIHRALITGKELYHAA